ncbi:hypothetical protein QQP08_007982 [Theobroma cacao]|uniref:Uncharacterized protein n=1 Tax=Theobroma cacao TaxID=3641 RepID=A0A061EAK5_THECC|nr:Uncharacterized protein TCM_007931 [Theobroma cacao]WRX15495.1 hypothetical protein QQP08_007982 [Theobroma cacao]
MSLRYLSRICVRALQGLKDHSSKGIMGRAKPRSEPGKSSQFGWVSRTKEPVKQVGLDDKQKLREAEKAENIMHLICWGPGVI